MIPTRESRPSTANTMMLVLKPRPIEYTTNSNVLMGSENEKEAWRKNRLMQMKLRAYLNEVHLQQESQARLLKTEEYRFLQEAIRRSGVPRSVNMLDQLHFFRDKTFPGRRFSTDWHFRELRSPLHKHPPLSARPIRLYRQQPLLNRPKTSATLYRKPIEDIDEDVDEEIDDYTEQANLRKAYEILLEPAEKQCEKHPNPNNRMECTSQQIVNISSINEAKVEPDWRQSTELPPIIIKDNKENMQPVEVLPIKDKANLLLPRELQNSIQTLPEPQQESTFIFNSTKPTRVDIATNVTLPSQRQRRESGNSVSKLTDHKNNLNRMDSFIGSLSEIDVEKVDINIDQDLDLEDNAFDKDAISASKINELIEKYSLQEPVFTQSNRQIDNERCQHGLEKEQPYSDNQKFSANLIEVKPFNENTKDQTDLQGSTTNEQTSTKPTKRLIRQNTKTNFNRIKNEPAPLRHNITSVLRQERTRYEASQNKVKDYLHKMSSKESREGNVSRNKDNKDNNNNGYSGRETSSARSRKSVSRNGT